MKSLDQRLPQKFTQKLVHKLAIGLTTCTAIATFTTLTSVAQNISASIGYSREVDELPPGSYLYGNSDIINEANSQYFAFIKGRDNKVIGRSYIPESDNAYCFQGTIVNSTIVATTFGYAPLEASTSPEITDGQDIVLDNYLRHLQIPRNTMMGVRECIYLLAPAGFREPPVIEIEPEETPSGTIQMQGDSNDIIRRLLGESEDVSEESSTAEPTVEQIPERLY